MIDILPKTKHAAFLTLGITFISILVLGLATLLLRHAETSEERIYELGSFEKFYVSDESVQDTYRFLLKNILNYTITVNNTILTPKLQKDVHFKKHLPRGPDPGVPNFDIARAILLFVYAPLLAPQSTAKFSDLIIHTNITPIGTAIRYTNKGNLSGIGDPDAGSNDTAVFFFDDMTTSPIQHLEEFEIIISYNESESLPCTQFGLICEPPEVVNATIAWDDLDPLFGGEFTRDDIFPPTGDGVNMTVTINGPKGWRTSESHENTEFISNTAGLLQKFYILNLTAIPAFTLGMVGSQTNAIFVNGNVSLDVEFIFKYHQDTPNLIVETVDTVNVSYPGIISISKHTPIKIAPL